MKRRLVNETFILDDNRLFAPVQVGAGNGYAHVDTGARHSSILYSHAGPFPGAGSRQIHGALGTTTVFQVRLDAFQFLGQAFHDVRADVQPDAVGGLDSLPFPVMMALGCDVLLQKPLYLDFTTNEIGFLDEAAPATAPQVRLEADFTLGLPLFQVSLGEHVLEALFDTGAGMGVINQQRVGALQEALTEAKPLEIEDATGVKHTLPTFKCRGLTVGERPLNDCKVLALDLGAFEQLADRNLDFVFGINAMRDQRWVINPQASWIEIG